MEDFVREIGRGSSLFLLYGEEGVGKSRLLSKLKTDRLADKNVHFIDFDTEAQNLSGEHVKAIAAGATDADVIIFDHFDSASNKSQQQIFDSWSTDGRDKNLNIIVCANSGGLNRFRQLAQQFQLEARSFQLLPCDQADREAYLQYLLYPDHPFATLVLPASVKRLVRQSKGFFNRLREIADHHSGIIEIKQVAESASRTMPIVIIISLFLGIAAAGYLFHLTRSSTPVELAEVQIQTEPNSTESEPEAGPTPEPESESEPIPEPEPQLESVPASVAEPESEAGWLERRLKFSRDWVLTSESNRGTIQIMSIEVERFNAKSFEAYLYTLQEQGLDMSQLRIFETQRGEQVFYSLMYGDYKDRREANRQISLLPETLRAEKPIPRSAGSIARGISGLTDN